MASSAANLDLALGTSEVLDVEIEAHKF